MEKEVKTTYLEEKTETETVTFCDACGLDCEERGGRETITVGAKTLRLATMQQRFKADVLERIQKELMVKGSRVDLTTVPRSDDHIGTVPIRELTYPEQIDGMVAVEKATQAAESAINEFAFDRYTTDPEDEFDICGHCLEALRETEASLETSLYEKNDEDEEEDDDYDFGYSSPSDFYKEHAGFGVTGAIAGVIGSLALMFPPEAMLVFASFGFAVGFLMSYLGDRYP